VVRATWLAPSKGDQVAVTGHGWRQKQAKQNVPRLLLQTAVICGYTSTEGRI
jgi:hypothetical protein